MVLTHRFVGLVLAAAISAWAVLAPCFWQAVWVRGGPAYSVNPFDTGFLPPKPTGLASFGLTNSSGLVSAYTVRSHMLVGSANISSLEVYYPNASSYNVSSHGASLQLNAMLVASSPSAERVYWVQDVAVFETNIGRLLFANNIWNMSGPGATLTNSSISSTSGGYVSETQRGAVYGSGTPNYTYVLPLGFRLIVAERVLGGVGVEVGFGAQLVENGTRVYAPILWFDNATIHLEGVLEAYFLVDGERLAPPPATGERGLYYDAELVFGGEANGAQTNFTALSCTIGLFYGANGTLKDFPTYYSFGADTAEGAYDLHVKYLGAGLASVTVGRPDYRYLGGPQQVPAEAAAGGGVVWPVVLPLVVVFVALVVLVLVARPSRDQRPMQQPISP